MTSVTAPMRLIHHAEPVRVRRSAATDIDAHTEQLIDWNLHYDQLDRGRFDGNFTDIRWPGLQVFVETTTRQVRQRGHLGQNTLGVATLLSGDDAIRINGKRGGTGSLIAVHSAELDVCTPANCTLAGLVIDADLVRSAASSMPELSRVLDAGSLPDIKAPQTSLPSFRNMLMSVVELAIDRPATFHDPVVQRDIRDGLILHLVQAMADAERSEEVHGAYAQKRLVDRACELMLANPEEPPTLLEVCNRIGASARKLGYCFQDVLGMSPARYVKAVRLNAVRRELRSVRDPFISIYDVAARWGFWHFGHFSADYKRQFAELPSDTLRRARGASPA
ncbi:helix-turn-helix domain-containing protein [Cupriavidus necator]